MSSSAGPIEGKYEVIAKIREGGMGAIYKVRHRLLNELRVIKVMRPEVAESAEQRKRFLREAQMATRLKHENVVSFYDFFVDDEGTAYMVMEYIEGINLRDMVRQCGPMPVALGLFLSKQCLSALSYLHRKGIVHRDIAPDNIMMMEEEDETLHAKLIDLGIAKLARAEEQEQLTAADEFIGKLRYSSPEQLTKRASSTQIDGRSDLFSYGIVLYESLTGVCPYGGGSLQDILQHRLHRPPFAFAETDPKGKVGTVLRATILRALERQPDDRYPDADAFAAALASIPADDSPPEDPAKVEAYAANAIELARQAAAAAALVGPSLQATLQSKFRSSEVSHRPVEATDLEARRKGRSDAGLGEEDSGSVATPPADDKTLRYAGPLGVRGTEDLAKPAKQAVQRSSPLGGYAAVAVGAALVVAIAVGLSVFLTNRNRAEPTGIAPTALPAPVSTAPPAAPTTAPTPFPVAQVLPTQPPFEKPQVVVTKREEKRPARREKILTRPTAVAVAASNSNRPKMRFCAEIGRTGYFQGVAREVPPGFQGVAPLAVNQDAALLKINITVAPDEPVEGQEFVVIAKFLNGAESTFRFGRAEESSPGARGGFQQIPGLNAQPIDSGSTLELYRKTRLLAAGESYRKAFRVYDARRGDYWENSVTIRPCIER